MAGVRRQLAAARIAAVDVGHEHDVGRGAARRRRQDGHVGWRLEHAAEVGGKGLELLRRQILPLEDQDVAVQQALLQIENHARRQRTTGVDVLDHRAQRRVQRSQQLCGTEFVAHGITIRVRGAVGGCV